MKLYAHPFSSYCQKVLTALYEKATPFEYRLLADPAVAAEHARLWPLRKMPVLDDGGRTVMEATVIVEYLDLRHPATPRLLPQDPGAALDVRLLDRVFDNYVMTPMQKIVGDHLRPDGRRDAHGVAEARALLDSAYAWLDGTLRGRTWAAGDAFTLADCAAAPSLFYADWVHPIPAPLRTLRDYRARLAGAALVRARRGRGAPVPQAVPARGARPRLSAIQAGAAASRSNSAATRPRRVGGT